MRLRGICFSGVPSDDHELALCIRLVVPSFTGLIRTELIRWLSFQLVSRAQNVRRWLGGSCSKPKMLRKLQLSLLQNNYAFGIGSFTTSRGFLSSRSATNFECRRRSPAVHSKNSICATASGRSHTHSFIFSAVNSSPLRYLRIRQISEGHRGGGKMTDSLEELSARSQRASRPLNSPYGAENLRILQQSDNRPRRGATAHPQAIGLATLVRKDRQGTQGLCLAS